MKKTLVVSTLFTIIAIHFCLDALSQVPEWADPSARKMRYKDSEFIIG